MATVTECCQSRILLYRHSVEVGVPDPEVSYRYMVAVDVYERLHTSLPDAPGGFPTLSAASRMSAGELYRHVYFAATIRQPHKRDCDALDCRQAQLMHQ